ncbi:MAG: V-type proton ATPase subunit F [Amphiamblys sp. WSBS2006]|nr:MAG: V-type proton ATPase subunit F [Amphiamblys sp. WSBS2006]
MKPPAEHELGRNTKETRDLICAIGDKDTVSGLLLTGIGTVFADKRKNYFVTENSSDEAIENAFTEFTLRKEALVIVITQDAANRIKTHMASFGRPQPVVVVIPSIKGEYSVDADETTTRKKS